MIKTLEQSVYGIRSNMLRRCLNPNDKRYKDYGGRGITVCERWQGKDGLANFKSDLKPRPSWMHTLDRRDNDGNYEPSNCHWATKEEQYSNMRKNVFYELDGLRMTHTQWAHKLGMSGMSLTKRINKWPLERALTEPKGTVHRLIAHEDKVCSKCQKSFHPKYSAQIICSSYCVEKLIEHRGEKLIEHRGEKLSLREWAIKLGMNKNTLSHRIRRGWSIERALTAPTL